MLCDSAGQSCGTRFGLVVDQVNDAEGIVVKPLNIRAYAGATIMGDGKLALILDVLGLASAVGITADINHTLQTIATGAEEMTSTVNEIAKNAQDAARVATEAVATAEATNDTVTKLGASSAEIGKVIEVITSIARALADSVYSLSTMAGEIDRHANTRRPGSVHASTTRSSSPSRAAHQEIRPAR